MISPLSSCVLFQFTPLREGRRKCRAVPAADGNFNSRPSARGDYRRINPYIDTMHFNSRPSARGDDVGEWVFTIKHISIHAPPRGATVPKTYQFHKKAISIHAPPRGATDGGVARRNRRVISIHAPPRGATGVKSISVWGFCPFQFTPLREGRRPAPSADQHHQLFQFTPLREGRPEDLTDNPYCDLFQFTPLREGRRDVEYVNYWQIIFQFTPLREGRPSILCQFVRHF